MFHRTIRTLSQTFIRLSIPLLVLGLVLGSATSASAQGTNFGLQPQEPSKGYFEYTLAAGETIQDVLIVSNPNETPLLLNIRAVRGTTMAAGGMTFSEETTGPAQWVTLQDSGIVTVPPTTTLSLSLEIAVPADTPPGEYVAGFLATPEEPPADVVVAAEGESASESSFQVNVVSRLGIAIIITVPEATHCEAAISSLTSSSDSGRWRFSIGMQNTGNVHFNSTGEVIARRIDSSEPVAQSPFEVGYFIPGDAIEYPLFLEPYPSPGEYQIEVNLLTNCGDETSFTQQVSISEEDVLQAAAEAQEAGLSSAASEEAAQILAQAELIRSISLLVGAVVALILVAIVIVIVLRRRNVPLVVPS